MLCLGMNRKKNAINISICLLFIYTFLLIGEMFARAVVEKGTTQTVTIGTGPNAGRLVYQKDEQGNRLPDFSHVGYHSGERDIPHVKTVIKLEPSEDIRSVDHDDTERIQAAIDAVGKRNADGNGHRGALLLTRGLYRISGKLLLDKSGVVLRGEGYGPDGTILVATGYGDKKHKRTFITVGDRRRPDIMQDSKQAITDDYVPIGAHSFTVASCQGYQVGDRIMVYRPSTAKWISHIGCDNIASKWTLISQTQWVKPGSEATRGESPLQPGFYYKRDGLSGRSHVRMKAGESWEAFQERVPLSKNGKKLDTTIQWQPGEYDFYFARKITKIAGNKIWIDAPIVHAMEQRFGGGAIFHYKAPGRVREVGIEDLHLISEFADPVPDHPYGDPKESTKSELHAWNAIKLNRNSENVWVRNVSAHYFGWSVVSLSGFQATVENCVSLGHASKIAGGRRYPFMIDGQRNLVQRCVAIEGRHEFVNQERTVGPNVFVDCLGLRSKSSAGPHHRYAVGNLYDNVRSDHYMESRNRGSSGTGHGWAGAQTCFWNCVAPSFKVEAPPGAISWVIGSGKPSEDDVRVTPVSLYYQQVFDRLGVEGVKRMIPVAYMKELGSYPWVPAWVPGWK